MRRAEVAGGGAFETRGRRAKKRKRESRAWELHRQWHGAKHVCLCLLSADAGSLRENRSVYLCLHSTRIYPLRKP